eukprot:737952-Prorocentrum_minimum.AAC.1
MNSRSSRSHTIFRMVIESSSRKVSESVVNHTSIYHPITPVFDEGSITFSFDRHNHPYPFFSEAVTRKQESPFQLQQGHASSERLQTPDRLHRSRLTGRLRGGEGGGPKWRKGVGLNAQSGRSGGLGAHLEDRRGGDAYEGGGEHQQEFVRPG